MGPKGSLREKPQPPLGDFQMLVSAKPEKHSVVGYHLVFRRDERSNESPQLVAKSDYHTLLGFRFMSHRDETSAENPQLG